MYKGIIYRITNKVNGLIYVGETTQTTKGRMARHIYKAKNNPLSPLHKAMQQFGVKNFVIEEIEEVEGCTKGELKQILRTKELYWIEKLNTLDSLVGYNQYALHKANKEFHISQLERGKCSRRFTDEQYREWGESMKDSEGWKNYLATYSSSGKAKDNYHKHKDAIVGGIQKALNKPVNKLDLQGNLICSYPSISVASAMSGVSIDSIHNYLYGHTKKPRKFRWEFINK